MKNRERRRMGKESSNKMEKVRKRSSVLGGVYTTWLPAPNLNFSVPSIGPIGPAPRSDTRAATRKREEEEGGKRCTALRNHFIAADATARCREEGRGRRER